MRIEHIIIILLISFIMAFTYVKFMNTFLTASESFIQRFKIAYKRRSNQKLKLRLMKVTSTEKELMDIIRYSKCINKDESIIICEDFLELAHQRKMHLVRRSIDERESISDD